jgi:hypothetical protein
VQRARAERLLEWAAQLRQRRWTRVLLPPRLRGIGLHRQPPLDAVGTHAVHAIPRHNDQTHAEALALVDELLAITDAPDAAPLERPRVLEAL